MANPKLSAPDTANNHAPEPSLIESVAASQASAKTDEVSPDQIDEVFKELKTLLTIVEKLQKAREDVGDIKPLLMRLLDGELPSGEELEQLKSGVGSLAKLVKLYGDYQTALEKAQPAKGLLDDVLKS